MLHEDPELRAQIEFEKAFDYDSFVSKLLVKLNKELTKENFEPVSLADPFKKASYTVRLRFLVNNTKGIGSPIDDRDLFNFICNGSQSVKDVLTTLASVSASLLFKMSVSKKIGQRRERLAGSLKLGKT